MPLTQIEPVAALVVIDLQKGVVGLPTAHPTADVTRRATQLARSFRAAKLPVILVNVAGRAPGRTEAAFAFKPPPDWTELVPELDQQPGDYTVTKLQVGAFYGTALEQILRRQKVTQVFLAGISTSAGVEATARSAYDHGYHVVLVVDAMTDLNAESHRHSTEVIFPRIGETATTDAVVGLLDRRSGEATARFGAFPLTAGGTLATRARPPFNMVLVSKSDRYFYSAVSFVFLALTGVGFRNFFLAGKESDGGAIPTPIKVLVIVHGTALTLWVVLFFIQSVLIASRNRKLHMNLGWVGAAVASTIALSGPLVAVSAIRASPKAHLFGMSYPQFLLPMLTEIVAFTVFVALGIWYRKRANVHRSMMLLATLSIISGSTSRTGFFGTLFGHTGWTSIFGPVFALAAVILLVRAMLTRRIDWWYAMGGTALAAVYVTAMQLAVGEVWTDWARRIAQG